MILEGTRLSLAFLFVFMALLDDLHDMNINVAIPLSGIALAYLFARFDGYGLSTTVGLFVGVLSVWAMNILGLQKLGGGDAKIVGMIGALIGWQPAVLTTLVAYLLSRLILSLKEYKGAYAYLPYILTSMTIVTICLNATSYLRN